MSSTNTFVDEYISIYYSEEFQLHVQSGRSYSLSRGNQLLSLMLLTRDMWEWQMKCQFTSANASPVPDSPQAPTEKNRIVPCTFGVFHGQGLWWELISPKGKLLMNGAFFFLEDGSHTVCVRVDDKAPFSEDVVKEFLSNVAFPGQPVYEAAAHTPQAAPHFRSPYAIELSYFVTFGAKGIGQPGKYNITYTGDKLTDEQRRAIDQFVDEELALSQLVLKHVYAYYKEEEFPALKGFVPDELLPQISCSEDMRSFISLEGIHLHAPRAEGDVPIGLSFDCSWSDNGVGVRVVGCTVEDVGTAYVAIEEE